MGETLLFKYNENAVTTLNVIEENESNDKLHRNIQNEEFDEQSMHK